jgi:hypothetical protein
MTAKELVEKYVYRNQTLIVEALIEQKMIVDCDTINYYDSDGEPSNIQEWWLVEERLLYALEQKGHTILKCEYGEWWGRCTTGQKLVDDWVIQKIAEEM